MNLKSSLNNYTEIKDIKVEIVKTPITLNVNISKTSIQMNDTATLSYEIKPEVPNKEVYIDYDKSIISIENNVIKPLKIGEANICIQSKYDLKVEECKKIEVTPICKNSYTFYFDGSKSEKITAGIDFCPGTYRIYAQVLNYNDIYYIYHKQPNFGYSSSTMTIAKFSDFLNDEGNQWAMSKDSYIETDTGITQITISK